MSRLWFNYPRWLLHRIPPDLAFCRCLSSQSLASRCLPPTGSLSESPFNFWSFYFVFSLQQSSSSWFSVFAQSASCQRQWSHLLETSAYPPSHGESLSQSCWRNQSESSHSTMLAVTSSQRLSSSESKKRSILWVRVPRWSLQRRVWFQSLTAASQKTRWRILILQLNRRCSKES